MTARIPRGVKDELEAIAGYAAGINDWLKLKKEILKSLKPRYRRLFSSHDPVTKKQTINEFDVAVARYWENLTKTELVLVQDGTEKRITT